MHTNCLLDFVEQLREVSPGTCVCICIGAGRASSETQKTTQNPQVSSHFLQRSFRHLFHPEKKKRFALRYGGVAQPHSTGGTAHSTQRDPYTYTLALRPDTEESPRIDID